MHLHRQNGARGKPRSPEKIRLGVIGLGNMGADHVRKIAAGNVPKIEITALCDRDPARLAPFETYKTFDRPSDLIRSGAVDAVLVATPHFDHTGTCIDALNHGLHVLVEKPISVHKADCERLIAAHTDKKLVFAAMFNQRTDPAYIKLRNLVRNGELGETRRINWIVTDWFRTSAYYASGGWRATWAGEGGGVLLNQCPHNLDLFQWIFGMPARVRGFCTMGRYHDIEVEDDVNAYFEFANGATGIFVTSTGEAPGTNRLEVVGERGRVVYEDEKLTFLRNETEMSRFNRASPLSFARPENWTVSIPVKGHGGQHVEILRNFADAILTGAPLIAAAHEGIHSVELANAILYSSLEGKMIEFPMDAKAYERKLKQLIGKPRPTKNGNGRNTLKPLKTVK